LGATLQISVNHLDRGSFALPAGETSLASQEYPNPFHGKALLTVEQLLALTDWMAVHACRSTPVSVPGAASSGPEFEDGKVAQPNPHASSALPARRSLRRAKRPTATPD